MFDQLAARNAAVDSGENAGICRPVDNRVEFRERFEVRGRTKIAVKNDDADALERGSIQLASRAAQLSMPTNWRP